MPRPSHPDASAAARFGRFLLENKAWWIVPILIVVALFAAVVVLGALGGATPSMYQNP